MNNENHINCPYCKYEINIAESLTKKYSEEAERRARMEVTNSYEKEKQELSSSYETKMKRLEEKLEKLEAAEMKNKISDEGKDIKIKKLELELENSSQKFTNEKEKFELEIEEKVKDKYQKLAEENYENELTQREIKIKELENKNRQLTENAQKGSQIGQQGSMQNQGEGGELFIEGILNDEFPNDSIEEVPKGKKGADCLHTVIGESQIIAGKIVYESKRTKAWSDSWIPKINNDANLVEANISVIVSDELGKNMESMMQIERGLFVCKFNDFRKLSRMLKFALLSKNEALMAVHDKEQKDTILYDYMSGEEFYRDYMLIEESYQQDLADIETERNSTNRRLNSRAKSAKQRRDALARIWGNLSAIKNKLPIIKALKEIDEIKMLGLPSLDEEE